MDAVALTIKWASKPHCSTRAWGVIGFIAILSSSFIVTATAQIGPKAITPGAVVTGELKRWHPITLTFEGPYAGENDDLNPFTDYRMQVVFRHLSTGREFLVPG